MIRLVLVFAILATVASAAIGSTLINDRAASEPVEMTMVADKYATGGASWSLLGGLTVIEKTGGCGTGLTVDATLRTPAMPAAGKGDKMASASCTVVAMN